jgi:hypothetical protein
MRRHARGQATVEFALVITAFLFLVFAGIEVSRAIFAKQTLARGAEVIAKELAQTNPDKEPLNVASGLPAPYIMSFTDVSTAIGDANRQSTLNFSTVWPHRPLTPTTVGGLPGGLQANTSCDATYGIDSATNPEPCYAYDAATGYCDLPATNTEEACQAAPSQDGSIEIIGYPDLTAPYTIKVTISEAYTTFLSFPLQFLRGNLSESVTATTLYGQANLSQ